MAEWHFGYGWSDEELTAHIEKLRKVQSNFPAEGPESQMTGSAWRRYYTEAEIGWEEPGPPRENGAFFTAWKAITEYQFSDPGIVTAHFDPHDELEGRTMLLELKVLGLRYLCGTRVTGVQKNSGPNETVYGFRYDTLEGHFEVGSEWFLLTKKHDTGDIMFRISASWRPGQFPNWWSRTGFEILGRRYQLAWHRLAYVRLREILGSGGRKMVPIPYGEHLVHTGPEITNSDLWILKQPSATERVRKMGQENAKISPNPEVTSWRS